MAYRSVSRPLALLGQRETHLLLRRLEPRRPVLPQNVAIQAVQDCFDVLTCESGVNFLHGLDVARLCLACALRGRSLRWRLHRSGPCSLAFERGDVLGCIRVCSGHNHLAGVIELAVKYLREVRKTKSHDMLRTAQPSDTKGLHRVRAITPHACARTYVHDHSLLTDHGPHVHVWANRHSVQPGSPRMTHMKRTSSETTRQPLVRVMSHAMCDKVTLFADAMHSTSKRFTLCLPISSKNPYAMNAQYILRYDTDQMKNKSIL